MPARSSICLVAALAAASLPACGDIPTIGDATRVAAPSLAAAVTPLDLPVYGLGALRRTAPRSPCAEGAFRQFDFWLGDWRARGAAAPPEAPGTPSRIRSALDGCAILEFWGGGGRSLNSWDPETGLWTQSWVTGQGRPFRMSGGLEGSVMALSGTRVQFGTGWHWNDDYRWTPVDANTVTQAWAFDIPDRPAQFGGPVHAAGVLTYRRATDLPAPTPPAPTPRCLTGEAAETRQLDFLAGHWTVRAEHGAVLGASEITVDATVNDCLIEERFTARNGYESLAWLYYDQVVHAFYRYAVDSEGETVALSGAVGGPLVLEGREPFPGAPEGRLRVTWTADGADRLRQAWEVSRDGTAWKTARVLVFEREE